MFVSDFFEGWSFLLWIFLISIFYCKTDDYLSAVIFIFIFLLFPLQFTEKITSKNNLIKLLLNKKLFIVSNFK